MLAIQKFQHVDWLKTYQLVPTLQKVEIKLHVYLYERVIKCSESFELPDIFCENLTEKFNELLAFIFHFREKPVHLNCNVWSLAEELPNKCAAPGGPLTYII